MDIALEGIGKRYGNDLALKPLDLQVPPGELLALLGPSGCGKTTLLRLIAGLIEPSQGKIEIRGRDVTHVPAHRRDVGLVFQNYALFPHMTVWQNVAFGLRMRGMPKADIRRIVEKRASELVQRGLLRRDPETGGYVLPQGKNSSRLAPPPVEMCPNWSSEKPRVRTAAAESPPPTTVKASVSVRPWATARVPGAKASNSRTRFRAVQCRASSFPPFARAWKIRCRPACSRATPWST